MPIKGVAGRALDPFFFKLEKECRDSGYWIEKMTIIHYYEHVVAYLIKFYKVDKSPLAVYWTLPTEESYFDSFAKFKGRYIIYQPTTLEYAVQEIKKWAETPGLQRTIFYFEEEKKL